MKIIVMDHDHHQHHAPKKEKVRKTSHAGMHHHEAHGHVERNSSKETDHLKHGNGQIHDKHAGHHTSDFLKRFWICLVLTIPLLALSPMIQHWTGLSLRFPGDKYILLGLGSVIYIYGGWPFIIGMIREIRFKAIGMMTLVALAITVAYLYSIAVIAGLQGMDFFWELATLIDIMLLGHWLEMRSQMAASRALESLVALLPSVVHIERNGHVVDARLEELKNGDIIIIKPGEKIAADGKVLEGTSMVNESMLTGESIPVKKEKDAGLIAGAVNESGSLRVLVTGTGADSYLNKVITMVESAQHAKSNTQNLADRVAKWLTIISITIGVGTFSYWMLAGNDLSFSLERMVTVMVTACPHALGVAIPLVVAISTTASATRGLLIRNRTAFENARKLTTIIFDKTGTLTKGSYELKKVIPINDLYTSEAILQYTAAVQQHSEHHIAQGVLKKLKESGLDLWKSEDFNYIQGVGVSATVKGKKVIAGGPNYFRREKRELPQLPEGIDQQTETINYVLIDGEPAGVITLSDSIRDTAGAAIEKLKHMGIRSFLLTGDNETIAKAVSQKLGMDGYLANVLPHEKQVKVKEFQDKGEFVAMTGDGVNDAPALAQADVGIAVGSGTDVAAETADIVLVNSDPEDVVKIISYGRATYRKMIENLAWAAGYNVIAIPLAAGVLYPDFILSPAMGAVLMSLSTVIVAINAQRLRLV